MPFRKYLEDHSFCPDTVKVMSEALTLVCRELDAAGIPQYSSSALVQMIVAVASGGEKDPERLARSVFQSVLNSRRQDNEPVEQVA